MRPGWLVDLLLALWMSASLGYQAAAAQVPDTLAQRALACTACHDSSHTGAREAYIPRIAGKPAGYLNEQLLNFREGRRKHDGMARLLENLSDSYLQDLALHFSSMALPYPPPPADARKFLTPVSARRAEQWIWRGDVHRGVPACAGCHGQALTGIAPQVPSLLGLPSDYLSAQLGAWRAGVRQARSPDCMAQIAARLPQDAIADIARWLAAQPVPPNAAPTTAPARWRCLAAALHHEPPPQAAPARHAALLRADRGPRHTCRRIAAGRLH